MEAEKSEKSGKIKLTFELEINQPAMDLIKTDIEMMNQVIPGIVQNWREAMMSRGKGHGMGMGMMHHDKE